MEPLGDRLPALLSLLLRGGEEKPADVEAGPGIC